MNMKVEFPGGLRVDTRVRGHVIATDQPLGAGGADSAPAPFDLFLASLATCAGYYALRFCQSRELSTAGLGVELEVVRDPGRPGIERVDLRLELPDEFPDRYRDAIRRAVDQCAVKRFVATPPPIGLELVAPRPTAPPN